MAINISGKRFVTTGNEHGLSAAGTVFTYYMDEEEITGHYSGGPIKTGQLVGRVTAENRIEVLFQCLTAEGELLSGRSTGEVSLNADSRTELDFEWVWLSGGEGGGTSSYIEIE